MSTDIPVVSLANRQLATAAQTIATTALAELPTTLSNVVPNYLALPYSLSFLNNKAPLSVP